MTISHCDCCGREFRIIDALLGNKEKRLCRSCAKARRLQLRDICDVFRVMVADNELTPTLWQAFVGVAEQRQLPLEDVQALLYADGLHLFQHTCETIIAQGKLSPRDEEQLHFLRSVLALSEEDIQSVWAGIERLRLLQEIQQGQFESIEVAFPLEDDEIAYYQAVALYQAPDYQARHFQGEQWQGVLTLSNKYLYFKPDRMRGWRISLWSIHEVALVSTDQFYVAVPRCKGEGGYTILDDDVEVTHAYVSVLLQQARQQPEPPRSGQQSALTTMRPEKEQQTRQRDYKYLAEQSFIRYWRYRDLPLECQYPIPTAKKAYRVEYAHVPTKTIIEIEDVGIQRDERQLQRYLYRQRALEASGWRFLRYSILDLMHDPMAVVEDARAVLLKRMHKLARSS
jgi:very-short-patch-repair endonuclease